MNNGILYIVGTPIGNLSDMTKRAIETLKEVDLILCEDTRNSLKLLNYFDIKNKLMAYHKFNENEKTVNIIKMLQTGKNIALITDAGMPCISDPGYVLVKEAHKNNISVIGVGGISAVTTSLSVSGIENNNFTFYGFFPRELKDKKNIIDNIKQSDIKTYIFYESPKRIIKTLEYLYQELNNISICVCSDLTKLHEKNYYGLLNEVIKELKDNPKSELGEYTFVLEKKLVKEKTNVLSIEAKLIDIVIRENVTIKEAINLLNKEDNSISKKDIYNASLNLKELLK